MGIHPAVKSNIDNQTFGHHDIMWAAREVERQGDGPIHVAHLLRGLAYARLFGQETLIDIWNVIGMNGMVRGENVNRFRQTNVTFIHVVNEAADWQDIERLMSILLIAQNDLSTDEFVKGFLDIHPFEDGNGRVASLLYNIKNGTTGAPVMLPDYYGE